MMASIEDIARLRRMTVQPNNVEPYTDDTLLGYLESGQNINYIAAMIWEEKAAAVAHLVTISEGGSSRTMSDLQKQYLVMATRYRELGDAEALAPVTPVTSGAISRKAERG